jgi:hypothetical protein
MSHASDPAEAGAITLSDSRDSPFEPSVRVSGPQDRNILGEWHERVLGNGNIVAGWITAENTGLGCGYSTSTDGGRTWSKPFFASGTGAGGDPWVAPDLSRPEDVYITCITDTGSGGNLTTWFASSTDGGLTWSGWDRGISWDPVVIDFYALHADAGRLVLIFNEALMDTNAIHSDDGGRTWSKKIDLSTGWPGCIVDDGKGKLFVTSGKRKQNAKWMSSADFGRTWSAPVNIGFMAEGRTDCAVDRRNGDLWLVNPGITSVLVARTSDGGATWKITNARTGMLARPDFAGIAVDAAGVAHVSWMDERDGSGNGFRYGRPAGW